MKTNIQVAKQPFGVPSKEALTKIETSDTVAGLSEAQYDYNIRRRELERQFEAKASELRDEYIATVNVINNGGEEAGE
jgi:hypothetical protein